MPAVTGVRTGDKLSPGIPGVGFTGADCAVERARCSEGHTREGARRGFGAGIPAAVGVAHNQFVGRQRDETGAVEDERGHGQAAGPLCAPGRTAVVARRDSVNAPEIAGARVFEVDLGVGGSSPRRGGDATRRLPVQPVVGAAQHERPGRRRRQDASVRIVGSGRRDQTDPARHTRRRCRGRKRHTGQRGEVEGLELKPPRLPAIVALPQPVARRDDNVFGVEYRRPGGSAELARAQDAGDLEAAPVRTAFDDDPAAVGGHADDRRSPGRDYRQPGLGHSCCRPTPCAARRAGQASSPVPRRCFATARVDLPSRRRPR